MPPLRDWNVGGPGLPFFLSGAVEATRVDRSAVAVLTAPGSRRRRILEGLIGEYEADAHEPEVWQAKVVVSTGEGTFNQSVTMVRCGRCDTRTVLRRFFESRTTYEGSTCQPRTADDVVREYTLKAEKEARLGLRILAASLAVIGVALVGNAVTRDVGWELFAMSAIVLVVALLFALGAHSRRPGQSEGGSFAPWWRTWWGRSSGFGAVIFVVLLIIAPKPGDPTLIVRPGGDPSMKSAPECPIVPAQRQFRAFGISQATRNLRVPRLDTDTDAVGVSCFGLTEAGSIMVQLSCVREGTDLRKAWSTDDAPFPIETDEGIRWTNGAQVLTWKRTSYDTRGVIGLRGDLSIQIVVFGGASASPQGRVQAVDSALRLLDYGRDASHIDCST